MIKREMFNFSAGFLSYKLHGERERKRERERERERERKRDKRGGLCVKKR